MGFDSSSNRILCNNGARGTEKCTPFLCVFVEIVDVLK